MNTESGKLVMSETLFDLHRALSDWTPALKPVELVIVTAAILNAVVGTDGAEPAGYIFCGFIRKWKPELTKLAPIVVKLYEEARRVEMCHPGYEIYFDSGDCVRCTYQLKVKES